MTDFVLHNDDCKKVMEKMPDESIDLVVTDCPYRIVKGGCTKKELKNEPRGIFNKRKEDTKDNSKAGKLFKHNDIKFKEWLPDVYRVLKENSHCYIMINARNLKDLQVQAEKVGFKFQQLIIWDKGNSIPNRYYLNSYELILMLRTGKAKNINNMGTKNILSVPNIIGNKTHPTEKPIDLMRILIENSSREGDVVLDPFMGTGSTGVACMDTNRKFYGIELGEDYFSIAEKRIEEARDAKTFSDR